MDADTLFVVLGVIVVLSPCLLFAQLGICSMLELPLTERSISRSTQMAVVTGLLAAIAVLVTMLVNGARHVPIELGNWVVIPESHYHFTLKFVFDRLSVPFAILSYLLVGTIGAFANIYLHREPGFNRFFLLYAMFLVGMVVTSLAGTIETLFAGWELVGLSSALLVAYFQERTAPVCNGLHIWTVYRVADAAFLIAAVALHHLTGEGDFARLMGSGPWPAGDASLTSGQALFVGGLLGVAAAGKSALIPFSGWLPRAMEGPTPSSAVFYGSLSVHLGAFLLLRISPILELSFWLCTMIVVLGLATALVAAIAARVQSDIKSALAFASLTQVGIIVAEIGCGLRYVALVHIIGHACLRTLQLLRAPTLLHDYHTLENAIGDRLPRRERFWDRRFAQATQRWFYRFAIQRGYLDALLTDFVVYPFVSFFQRCDEIERKWTALLSGDSAGQTDSVSAASEDLDEIL